MTRPLVVVIENPQHDPTVIGGDDVEVETVSSYPATYYCPDEEVVDAWEGGYLARLRALRDRFPEGDERRGPLDSLVTQFLARVAAVRRTA